ncbi:MAG: hypothetical protein ABDH23_06975 [Endomicrobiia bacterium]
MGIAIVGGSFNDEKNKRCSAKYQSNKILEIQIQPIKSLIKRKNCDILSLILKILKNKHIFEKTKEILLNIDDSF